MKKRVLLVEDRETTRLMVEETLRRRGYDVASAGSVAEAKGLLEQSPDLVLTDLQLPDGSGIELLKAALERDARLPVIVMSAFGTIEIAVEAVKRGAYDFVPKPFDTKRLSGLVAHALERRPRASAAAGDSGLIGTSAAIQKVVSSARRVAPSDATVLVLGESGTGKELVARAIHKWSGRSGGPLVTVNCAAVPRELMEAEFFGSEKGAFTGASARKLGKVELASGGTLFLDEIGELPGELQPKLLRALQERTFMRVGGTVEVQADIRVIAATNRDLAGLVHEGLFREDLYYRLNVFPIRIPPLRERPEDVLELASFFVQKIAASLDREPPRISRAAALLLERMTWPGNTRQLQNAIERAVILADGSEILPEHFDSGSTEESPAAPPVPSGASLIAVGRAAQRHAETEAIRRTLRETGGNKTEAARRLGISYKTLWSKLKDYEIG
jgi:DNA-binding NtrC family response regulator